MSAPELQRMLAAAHTAGAMLVGEDDLADLRKAAQHNNFLCKQIDLAGCRDKFELLNRIAHALQFPATFGHNWDALSDCLGDLSWLPAKGYWIDFPHTAEFRLAAEDDFETLMQIFDDVAMTWLAQKIAFWSAFVLPEAQLDALDGDVS